MYAATRGPNVKWGGTYFKWGGGHHWPPAGDGPGKAAGNVTKNCKALSVKIREICGKEIWVSVQNISLLPRVKRKRMQWNRWLVDRKKICALVQWRLVVKMAGRAAKLHLWLNIQDCRVSSHSSSPKLITLVIFTSLRMWGLTGFEQGKSWANCSE